MIEANKNPQLAQHAKRRLERISSRVKGLSTSRQAKLLKEFIGGMKGAASINPQQSLTAITVLEVLLFEPAERPNKQALTPPSNQGPVDSRRDQPC